MRDSDRLSELLGMAVAICGVAEKRPPGSMDDKDEIARRLSALGRGDRADAGVMATLQVIIPMTPDRPGRASWPNCSSAGGRFGGGIWCPA